jgi:hypothetical protein
VKDLIKEDEMGKACSMDKREVGIKSLVGKLKEREH